MRAHGMPNFPEPPAGGGGFVIIKQSLDAQDPRFQRAFADCRSLIGPNLSPAKQAASETQALKFARCMRAHGVTSFPDPQGGAGGNFVFRVHSGGALNKNNPVFDKAARACSGGAFGRHKR